MSEDCDYDRDLNKSSDTDFKSTLPRYWVVPLKTLIINDGKGLSAWLRQDRVDEIHVVEYSALESAQKEIELLKLAARPVIHERLTLANERIRELEKALGDIAKKAPHKVNLDEAADMACEFALIARAALKQSEGNV